MINSSWLFVENDAASGVGSDNVNQPDGATALAGETDVGVPRGQAHPGRRHC